MFYKKLKNNYLYNNINQLNPTDEDNKNISLPLVIDTEFWDSPRKCATVQIKGIHNNYPKIYAHQNIVDYGLSISQKVRHNIIESDCVIIEYLKDCGYNVSLKSYGQAKTAFFNEKKHLPILQLDIYCHFALAELLMIFDGQLKEDIINIITRSIYKKIELGRRLRTYTINKKGKEICDYIKLPWLFTINDREFKVTLRIIDTCALHGIASYTDLCESTGIELKAKGKLTQEDKEAMNQAYFNHPDFDDYALGDLEVYQILENNANNFKLIYDDLGISEYYQPPKLTIGSTVQNIFKACLFKHFGISHTDNENQKKLIDFCKFGSASTHKLYTQTTRCLLAKVNGGRCRNNRPVTNYLEGTIIDADIASAYATALRNQVYPIGKPIIEDFEANLNNNRYLTLRQWLKHRKYRKKNNELINGLWQCVVSNKQDKDGDYDTLKYSQDFIISWFDFKYEDIQNMNTDNDNNGKELDVKTGKIKIFNNQVINGIITSDVLEWIIKIASRDQKNELLDNLYVLTATYYPNYSRLNNFEDLCNAYDFWNEENTTVSKKKQYKSHKLPSGQILKIFNIPTFWIGLKMSDLMVDKLIAYRAFYKFRDGKKCPLQTLFKLINNTLYGDFCSPFFDISNTIVGNNITAKVRTMAWCMEKGLYGVETITDGTAFDSNKICYPKGQNRRLNGLNTINLYAKNDTANQNILLKPLEGLDKIEHFYDKENIKLKIHKDGKLTIIEKPDQWFNQKIIEHLQQQFRLSILHDETLTIDIDKKVSLKENKPVITYKKQKGLFSIEIKDIYDYGCFHGASNYLLSNQNGTIVKMRSYESNKPHYTFDLTKTNELIETNFYNESVPSEVFLQQLINPLKIKRAKAFKKTGILKVNEFRNNSDKWLELGFTCGDTIEKTGMLKEISLSQFTYLTMNQYIKIEKEYERNKRKFEQSYEGFFLNNDNTLNYLEMIITIDKLIRNGVISINNELDKNRNRKRDIMVNHPDSLVYRFIKENLTTINKNIIIADEDYIFENLEGEEIADDDFLI